MSDPWSADDLRLLGEADELRTAVRQDSGSRGRWVPIWVVCAGGRV